MDDRTDYSCRYLQYHCTPEKLCEECQEDKIHPFDPSRFNQIKDLIERCDPNYRGTHLQYLVSLVETAVDTISLVKNI